MITKSINVKQYHSAHNRFLKPMIVNFLVHELRYLGPVTAANVADELIRIFEENVPLKDRLKHGQMLWNALDKNTRADSPNRKYRAVVLSVVTDGDVALFEQGTSIRQIRKQVIARIMKEAYEQGGILSTRDAGLILSSYSSPVSRARIEYEKDTQTVLPHPRALHDMGSTVTHKQMIIYKYAVEKKTTDRYSLFKKRDIFVGYNRKYNHLVFPFRRIPPRVFIRCVP